MRKHNHPKRQRQADEDEHYGKQASDHLHRESNMYTILKKWLCYTTVQSSIGILGLHRKRVFIENELEKKGKLEFIVINVWKDRNFQMKTPSLSYIVKEGPVLKKSLRLKKFLLANTSQARFINELGFYWQITTKCEFSEH